MSYKSIARSGAEGNTHLLKSYGGGSSGPRQAYATGGAVRNSPNPALAEGLSAAGGAAKPSLARPGRKMASKAKGKGKKETQINVIVAPSGGDKAAGPVSPGGPMPPMAGPPGPPPMPPGPPMPPPGAGPGPMPPMRARGGKVVTKSVKKRESGGRATISADSLRAAREERAKAEDKLTDRNINTGLAALSGAATMMPGSGRLLRGANALFTANNVGSMVGHTRRRNEHLAEADRIERGQVKPGEEDRKNGGAVSKSDAAVKIAKAEESPGRASGGSVKAPKFDAGAGGGEGRLEKAAKYGK